VSARWPGLLAAGGWSGHDVGVDLAAAIDELYGLAPEEFVARRVVLAQQAREFGDRGLAGEIGKLRKPTVGAWLSNLLARTEQGQLEQLVDLGRGLRDAQDTLDGSQLRELGRQRSQLVSALALLGRRHAAQMGHPVGESAVREVESTLTAALSDPGAAELVLAGALTQSLEFVGSGFGPVSVSGAGADVRRRGPAAPRPTPVGSVATVRKAVLHSVPTSGGAGEVAAEEVDRAERALAQARLHAAEAAQRQQAAAAELDEAAQVVAEVSARQDSLAAQISELVRQQDAAHEDSRQARTRLDAASRAGRAADRGVDQAQSRVADAEAVLEGVRPGGP